MEHIKIRFGTLEDGRHMEKWLLEEEGLLRWFPMSNEIEIKDAVNACMNYVPKKAVLTAEFNKKVSGMATLYVQFYEKFKHNALFVIIVNKEYRNKGIGTALLKELFKIAKENFQIEILHLEVYEDNPAIALYERLGFKKYGVNKRFLKEPGMYLDQIMMEKYL